MNEKIKAEIKELLENAIISDKRVDLQAYKDIVYKNQKPKPKIVVRVKNYKDVSKLLKFCNENRIVVVPWGGGTNLCGALTTKQECIALDLKSLNNIIKFSKEDYFITVQSGTTIEKIENYLNKFGLTLGHDPWSRASATIGGAISLDSIGNLYPKFGSIGNLVLSLKVCLADGRIIDVGKKITKTSSTPFLPSLFIGSEGLFGVILEATLKVRALAESFDTLGYAFSSFQNLFLGVKVLEENGIEPHSYIGGTIPKEILKILPKTEQILIKSLGIKAGLFLYYEGIKSEVKGKMNRAEKLLNKLGKKLPKKYAKEWWKTRYTYFEMNEKLADKNIYLHVFDLCLPRSAVLKVYEKLNKIADKLGLKNRISHTLFCGVDAYTLALYVENNQKGNEQIINFEKELIKIVHSLNGSITRNHGLGTIFDKKCTTTEIGKDSLYILKEIKKIFDKNRILNRGIMHKEI